MLVILQSILIIWKETAKVILYRLQAGVGGVLLLIAFFIEWLESHDAPHLLILHNIIL